MHASSMHTCALALRICELRCRCKAKKEQKDWAKVEADNVKTLVAYVRKLTRKNGRNSRTNLQAFSGRAPGDQLVHPWPCDFTRTS